jgi:hypothetical protein
MVPAGVIHVMRSPSRANSARQRALTDPSHFRFSMITGRLRTPATPTRTEGAASGAPRSLLSRPPCSIGADARGSIQGW